jgi:hypothetical protein
MRDLAGEIDGHKFDGSGSPRELKGILPIFTPRADVI